MSDQPTVENFDEKHKEFLNKLAYDDQFRATFQANPQAALLDLGLIDQISDRRPSTVPTLPTKDEVRAVLNGAEGGPEFDGIFCRPGFCAFSSPDPECEG